MAEKETRLSIVIRTVDQATAKIKAINDRLDAASKPVRNFKAALSDLGKKSGLDDVLGGIKGVGSAIGDLLSKVAVIGGVAGLAVGGLVHLVDQFDDLGKKAARLGVGVDFLAEMRYAAEKTGVPLEALDSGLEAFNQNLGQARAGTGRMAKFLALVSNNNGVPVLLNQLKAAKDNAAAFDLLAGAMAKVTDPAKRAALAQKTLGDSALAPLFAQGAKGIAALRARYLQLAGSQEGAASSAEETKSAMVDLHAATDGIKAALVKGLSPALTKIVNQMTEWLTGHRAEIAEWAEDIGRKLPGAIQEVVVWLGKAYEKVKAFVDTIGGIKGVVVLAAAALVGPLVSAFATLGAAMVGTPFGEVLLALGAILAMATSVTAEIEKFSKALDTSHEQMMADSVKLSPEQFRAKYPQVAAAGADINPADPFGLDARARASGVSRKSDDQSQSLTGPDALTNGARALEDERSLSSRAPAPTAKVTVDFANMPRGARVKADPQSTADVDLSVGYQMGLTP